MQRPNSTLERRFTFGEIEVSDNTGSPFIRGHAAVFDKLSENLGGFVEIVGRSAFNRTIQQADVRALYNHDENMVLGRSSSGTLKLSIDGSGLYYEISPPDTTYARDLMTVMERGDVNQSSFAFFTNEDLWAMTEAEYPLRTLTDVTLVDISPVTYPAYPDADSGLGRSAALASLSKRSGKSIVDLSDSEAIKVAIRASKANTYTVAKSDSCPVRSPWAVMEADGDVVSCDVDEASAHASMAKLMAAPPDAEDKADAENKSASNSTDGDTTVESREDESTAGATAVDLVAVRKRAAQIRNEKAGWRKAS